MLLCVLQVLEKRLRDRGTEDDKSLATRLHNAREEMEYGSEEVRPQPSLTLPALML